jgi:hypothetical protein
LHNALLSFRLALFSGIGWLAVGKKSDARPQRLRDLSENRGACVGNGSGTLVRVLLAALAVILGGCVRHDALWGRSGATRMDYDRDLEICDRHAAAAIQTPDSGKQAIEGDAADRESRKRRLIDRCMIAKGWTVPGS